MLLQSMGLSLNVFRYAYLNKQQSIVSFVLVDFSSCQFVYIYKISVHDVELSQRRMRSNCFVGARWYCQRNHTVGTTGFSLPPVPLQIRVILFLLISLKLLIVYEFNSILYAHAKRQV